MIKHPAEIRELVTSRVFQLCKSLQLDIAARASDEIDLIRRMEERAERDIAIPIINAIMQEFGAEASKVKDPRFDKVRRAAAHARPKLRGETPAERRKREEREMQGLSAQARTLGLT
jgi:hypothetical protein